MGNWHKISKHGVSWTAIHGTDRTFEDGAEEKGKHEEEE